jgi:hypothetical protein
VSLNYFYKRYNTRFERGLHCVDYLEGLVGDFNADVFFGYSLNSCVEQETCMSKEMLENEVHVFTFVATNAMHAPHHYKTSLISK